MGTSHEYATIARHDSTERLRPRAVRACIIRASRKKPLGYRYNSFNIRLKILTTSPGPDEQQFRY